MIPALFVDDFPVLTNKNTASLFAISGFKKCLIYNWTESNSLESLLIPLQIQISERVSTVVEERKQIHLPKLYIYTVRKI